MMSKPVHISSLVVYVERSKLESVIQQTKLFPQIEIQGQDPAGKFIVLLETEEEQSILTAIDYIQDLDGVLTATLVYHQIDSFSDQ